MEVNNPVPESVTTKSYVILCASSPSSLQSLVDARLNNNNPNVSWELVGSLFVTVSPSYTRDYYQTMVLTLTTSEE